MSNLRDTTTLENLIFVRNRMSEIINIFHRFNSYKVVKHDIDSTVNNVWHQ